MAQFDNVSVKKKANIYFDGTTIATISDENGNFTLSYGSKLNSILAISFIGYQTQFLNNFNSDKRSNHAA